jgi:hypothetical protein
MRTTSYWGSALVLVLCLPVSCSKKTEQEANSSLVRARDHLLERTSSKGEIIRDRNALVGIWDVSLARGDKPLKQMFVYDVRTDGTLVVETIESGEKNSGDWELASTGMLTERIKTDAGTVVTRYYAFGLPDGRRAFCLIDVRAILLLSPRKSE